VEKKVITSFTNNSTTEDVDFEIFGYNGKDLVKDLKLRKSFHTSNMHLFHPEKGIHKYTSPEEILKDFVKLRSDHYIKRKEHLLKVLETKATMCGYKSKFVTMVINGDIIVFKRKKDDLERQLAGLFPRINDSFDYLLNIKTVQYTEECVKELLSEAATARRELEIMKNTSHIDMWKSDIKNL
jgi:DNA topoisomerase-2